MCKLSGLFTGNFIHFFFLPFFILPVLLVIYKYACEEKDTRPNLLFFFMSLYLFAETLRLAWSN